MIGYVILSINCLLLVCICTDMKEALQANNTITTSHMFLTSRFINFAFYAAQNFLIRNYVLSIFFADLNAAILIILRYSIALHWRVFPTTRGLRNFHGHGARGGQRLVVERVVDVVVVVGGGGGRGVCWFGRRGAGNVNL